MTGGFDRSIFATQPSRRGFLRGSAAAAGFVALAGGGVRRAFADEKVLNMLSWPGHAAPEVVANFEKEHGVKVQAKEYTGGEEMLSLLQSSPAGTFDVILTDAEYVTMLNAAGLIDELDPAEYPLGEFWPEFQKFPPHWIDGKLYSMINSFGYLGMVYNTEKLTADELKSYKIMWDPKVTGKLGMYDWYLPAMSCLSMYNGNRPPYDIDADKFAKLKETLFSLSPQMSGIGSWSSVFSALTNGEAWVMPGVGAWAAILLAKDGVPIKAAIPDEGAVQWTESLSIASNSANKDLAKAFLKYRAGAQGQVETALKPSYASSIPSKAGWEKLNADNPEMAAVLEHQLDKPNVMDDIKSGKIDIRGVPTQQSIEEWAEAFTEFKNM